LPSARWCWRKWKPIITPSQTAKANFWGCSAGHTLTVTDVKKEAGSDGWVKLVHPEWTGGLDQRQGAHPRAARQPVEAGRKQDDLRRHLAAVGILVADVPANHQPESQMMMMATGRHHWLAAVGAGLIQYLQGKKEQQ
jgi:hypothetical protein